MGDDTWTQMLPGVFHKDYSFPSLDIKDLHTVDDGVWKVS
jgi:GPI ethanolamine phosphate transferase 3 subunit O